MGHWSEGLVPEIAEHMGIAADHPVLSDLATEAAKELEVLTGRTYQPVRRRSSTFESNGLPFVDVPEIHVGSVGTGATVWEIPDPIDRGRASVLQLAAPEHTVPTAASIADGLGVAGQVVGQAAQAGALSGDHVLRLLGTLIDSDHRVELLRRVMDPAVRCYIPITCTMVDGWWIQIARRVLWITADTEDEGRLMELLLNDAAGDGAIPPLAAAEPILIAAPLTRHPVEWAFAARIWTEAVRRPVNRPWGIVARAVHGHGIPTITVDQSSTSYEIACQVLLKAYWHGYITGDEPALANALTLAYPNQVRRIQRETGAPSVESAAATLLEGLIRPGFDPAQGAEATRRYVRRKASIAVMEHRKRECPDRYPWTRVGISERRYYKLLPLFAQKENGRYAYNHDEVIERMTAFLNHRDTELAVRAYARDVLLSHGFADEAARKWLQRHRPEEAVDAWPRARRQGAAGGNSSKD